MTAEIFDLTSRIKLKPDTGFKTLEELIASTKVAIAVEWEKAAIANKLNEHFIIKTSQFKKQNFMEDLNAISSIEKTFDFAPAVFSPGASFKRQLGWIVEFKIQKHIISTPELSCEAHARCYSILLFLHLNQVGKAEKLL